MNNKVIQIHQINKIESYGSLQLIKRIASSSFFVQYLAKLKCKNQQQKYVIVFKPINLANPYISYYNTIRYFLSFMPSLNELKYKFEVSKDVRHFLDKFQEVFRSEFDFNKQQLSRQFFNDQTLQNSQHFNNQQLLDKFIKFKSQYEVTQTPYWKLLLNPINLQEFDQEQKQAINQHYSQFFGKMIQKVQIKLLEDKIQNIVKLSNTIHKISIYQSFTDNIRQAYIIQNYFDQNQPKKISNNSNHQEIYQFLKKQISLLSLTLQNCIENVQKTISQMSRLGYYLCKQLERFSQLEIVYPLHPKYIIYNSKNQHYRLSIQPLLLQCLGLKKQPKDLLGLMIQRNCRPVEDLYQLLDKLKYERTNQGPKNIGKSKDFINIVKTLFILSEFRKCNIQFVAKILNSENQEKKFKLIGQFIKHVFTDSLKKQTLIKTQTSYCESQLLLPSISHIIKLKKKEEFKKQASQTQPQSNHNNMTQEQLTQKVYNSEIQIQLSQISNIFYIGSYNLKENQFEDKKDQSLFFYFDQYKSFFEQLSNQIQSWMWNQSQNMRLVQLQFKQDKQIKLANKFIILLYAKTLFHQSCFLVLELFLIKLYPQETYFKKQSTIQQERKQKYYHHQKQLNKTVKQIDELLTKIKISNPAQFQLIKKNQYENNRNDIIYSINLKDDQKRFWTDQFLQFPKEKQYCYSLSAQFLMNFKRRHYFQRQKIKLQQILQKRLQYQISRFKQLMASYFTNNSQEFQSQYKYIKYYLQIFYRISDQSLSIFDICMKILQDYKTKANNIEIQQGQNLLTKRQIDNISLQILQSSIKNLDIYNEKNKKLQNTDFLNQ